MVVRRSGNFFYNLFILVVVSVGSGYSDTVDPHGAIPIGNTLFKLVPVLLVGIQLPLFPSSGVYALKPVLQGFH